MIVGIDKYHYDCKSRLEFQKRYNIEPYYFSQDTLKNVLLSLKENVYNCVLTSVIFTDDSIVEEVEYIELTNLILKKEVDRIYENVNLILDEFDTEIEKISIRYLQYDLSISSNGLLVIRSDNDKFNFDNNTLSRIIIGA